ncbi:MAG: S41 family peptidase [Phycisphaerae bacterium]
MPKKNLIWILIVVAVAVLLLCVTRNHPPIVGDETGDFEPVLRTYSLIRENYYETPDADALRRGAVRGMVQELDEFSSYVPPRDLPAFEDEVMGMASGLGLRLHEQGGKVVVLGPLPGSPAAMGGVEAGDAILSVDDRDVSGLTVEEVEKLLSGQPGGSVSLTILRDDEEQTLTLTRGEFPLEIVQGLYRDHTGLWVYRLGESDEAPAYLRLCELSPRAQEAMHAAFRKLDRPGGLLLDLRDNPGGHLASASAVADLFLREGVIMTVIHRGGDTNRHIAHFDGTLPDIPMVVLVNGGTASGAEIIAGALRLHGRAVLVGTRTRGKGCVQSMYRLGGDLGQVNLTTSEFYVGRAMPITRRPGRDVWGVDPHEQVPLRDGEMRRLSQFRYRQEVLPRRGTTTRAATPESQASAELERILEMDRQLARAVELLSDSERMEQLLRRGSREDEMLERRFLSELEEGVTDEDEDER